MALDFESYRLVVGSSLYDDVVGKHVAKGVSRLEAQMNAQTFDLMDSYQ